MAIKKKFHGGLKVLLLLLFIILLGTCSTSYAADYTDFDIPIEFWENLITFINANASNYSYGSTISKTAQEFKNEYDNSLKNNLKTQFTNAGADERNLQLFIYNNLNYSVNSGKFLQIYFLLSNNSVNNIENSSTWLVNSNGKIAQTNMSLSPNIYVLQLKGDIFSVIIKSDYYGSHSGFTYNSNIVNFDNSTLLNGPWFGVNQKPLNIVNFKPQGQSSYSNFFLENFYNINPTPVVPEEPSGDNGGSTGTITNPSGEVTGQIDLSGIENGIIQINDTISGEGQAIRDTISGESEKIINSLTTVPNLSGDIISSGDITSKIDFSLIENNQNFTAYSNFWLNLINGLRSSLTGNKRSLEISFRGESYVLNLDDFTLQVPQELKFLLGMWSTIYFVILIVKWWKVIIDKVSSGDIDEVLQINEEERYC